MNKVINVIKLGIILIACICTTTAHTSSLEELRVECCVFAKLQLKLPVGDLMARMTGKCLSASAVSYSNSNAIARSSDRTVIRIQLLRWLSKPKCFSMPF